MHPDSTSRYIVEDRGYITPCWIWQGATDTMGYGSVRDGRRTRKAHIVAYEREYGPVPAGLVLDHLCEQKPCVNPDHTEPVTHTENIRRSKHTKLNEAAVAEIRALRGVESGASLARRFGVTRSAIYRVQMGQNWPDPDHVRPAAMGALETKLTADDVREIRRLHGHVTIVELGRQFGVNHTTISGIQRGKSHRHVE